MPIGLELFNADASLLLGITTYVGTFRGSFSTNGQATGSITDSSMIGKSLLTFLPDTGLNGSRGGPDVVLNSGTGVISWSYPTYSGSAPAIPNEVIYYGGY